MGLLEAPRVPAAIYPEATQLETSSQVLRPLPNCQENQPSGIPIGSTPQGQNS
jgi:hypothetical protein